MIEVNGRRLTPPRTRPRVVICLDGSGPDYLADALAAGLMPELERWRQEGTYAVGRSAVPTFTNPNNVSIICAVPPSVHGISGNHFWDATRGVEVQMTQRAHVRAGTILEALAEKGLSVLAITAKHKLVDLIHPGDPTRAFSAEQPGELGRSLAPEAPPNVYSAEASLWVLDAGIAALERKIARVLFLSTTDYVQHKYPPGSPEARAFYAAVDRRLARFAELGAVVGLTADHGMTAATRADGSPNVVFLRPLLEIALGRTDVYHLTLPITDPYVVHHGTLGGCAMVYLADGSPARIAQARATLEATTGIELVLTREEAAREYELPRDRIGDLVVLAAKGYVLGKSEGEHDLSHVQTGLRSHGSMHERAVPLVLNVPLREEASALARAGELANWDIFPLLLGGAIT